MIRYFDEIENPNNVTIKLLEKHPKTFMNFKYLPEDLAIRCAILIGRLDELNPLHLTMMMHLKSI